MGHEDSAFEIGFGENVGQRSGMVKMETGAGLVSFG
jgi:hypothetical protein